MGKLNKLTKHTLFIKMNFIDNSPQCQAKVRKFQEIILLRQGRETSSINNKEKRLHCYTFTLYRTCNSSFNFTIIIQRRNF